MNSNAKHSGRVLHYEEILNGKDQNEYSISGQNPHRIWFEIQMIYR